MNALDVIDVSVAYDGKPVIAGVDLALEAGVIGCLLGPSGCGKTSLLRAIAGFEPVATGEIRLDGRTVSTPRGALAPERRNVGMVFQDFALFPHLTVADNIAFGLRKRPAAERARRLAELLDLIGLAASAGAYPHQLSGGQQQRVALARAMAPRPAILLMDEPFSSIDTELRVQLAAEVRAMMLRDGMTAILVTHDQHEAFAIADRIAVIGDGRLRQWDRPYALYHQPADRFVADFIGEGATIAGEIVGAGLVRTGLGEIAGDLAAGLRPGDAVAVLVRPDDIVHDDASPTRLPVVARTFRGSQYLYELRLPTGETVFTLAHSHREHEVGEAIGVRLDVRHLTVFSAGGDPVASQSARR
ncbi:MAG TPA: ABC transporter ATP-binding protein [Kaistiaceae bacterium]|nr:ABC transporter ATP-binding protein [Kaistiaceae bacterium]